MSAKEGFLEKKTVLGFWVKRFCKLVDNRLQIFKKENDKSPEIEITMNSSVSTEITDASNNRFKVASSSGEIIHLQAKGKNLMMMWILDLRSCSFSHKSMTMDDFDIISVIGRGNYGKVMLCRKKNTNELLAIKSVHKDRLIKENKVETILTERSILAKVNSPFIVSLKYAFQTSSKFYLCLEYAPGGDLFNLMKRRQISLHDIKLYIIEISLALNELHRNNIIYRDLKPENILFDDHGHIKLTDFGLSKELDKSNDANKTFCGTSDYMAPEIVKRSGYDKQIDWWGVGVVAYEMIFGNTPFASLNKNRLYSNIVNKEIYFDDEVDDDLKELLKSLLDKNPKKRGGFETIKKSNFFKEYNFDDVLMKKIQPDWVPIISHDTSIENFDPEFTEERPYDSMSIANDLFVSNFSYSAIEKFSPLENHSP